MIPRVIDRLARWRSSIEVEEALVVIVCHDPLTRFLDCQLLLPGQIPEVGCLLEERRFVSLVSTRAWHPFVSYDYVSKGRIIFSSSTPVTVSGGVIPPVIIFAAVADWKTPLAR